MRRPTLNKLAGLVIVAGGLFLSTSPVMAASCSGPAGAGGCTCTSGDGAYTCTGDSCTASATGCTSQDRVAKLADAPVN
jgi:hypothetical protein